LFDVGGGCDQISNIKLLHQEPQGEVNGFGRHGVKYAKGGGGDGDGDAGTAERHCLGVGGMIRFWFGKEDEGKGGEKEEIEEAKRLEEGTCRGEGETRMLLL